jgi:sensor domain CHASE-containing protein
MENELTPKQSAPHVGTVIILAALGVIILVGGSIVWFSEKEHGLQLNLNAANERANAAEDLVTNLNSEITSLQSQLTNTSTAPVIADSETVKRASITCADARLLPQMIQYGYDDPRDYLSTFFAALSKGDTSTATLFLKPVIENQQLMNLNKDYRNYTFSVGSWNQANEITVQITTGKENGCWKIVLITDPSALLQ